MAISYKSEQNIYKFEQNIQAGGVNASISILMMTQITQVQIGGGAKRSEKIDNQKPKAQAATPNVPQATKPTQSWLKNLLPAPAKKPTENTEQTQTRPEPQATKSPPKWFYSEDAITDVDVSAQKSKQQPKTAPRSAEDIWHKDSKYDSWA